jgi:hypothetical protein
MKDRLRMIPGTTLGKVICGVVIFFLLVTSAYGTAVQVINFPALMSMVQKMVTQAITDKIKAVWNEEVKIKLEPGTINTKAVSFLKYNISSYTDKMISQYMKNNTGAFAKGDGKLFAETAKNKTSSTIPSANSDFKEFQKKIREVSILLAGAPGGGTDKMKHFTTAEYAAVKLRDVFNQASVAAYEKASEGVYVAERFRKDLSSFDPAYIDGAKSDQAVKDMAKLAYYNTMLQSEILAVMARAKCAGLWKAGRDGVEPPLFFTAYRRDQHDIARSDVWLRPKGLCGCSAVPCCHRRNDSSNGAAVGCVFQNPLLRLP